MKECYNCTHGAWLNGKDALPQICTECNYAPGYPSKWEEKPKTNADRIRAMTDEELAELLANEVPHDCAYCNLLCATFDGDKFAGSCQNAFYRWLQQPCEGE